MSVITQLIKKLTSKHLAKSIAANKRKGKKSKKSNRAKGKELNEKIKELDQKEQISRKAPSNLFNRHKRRNPAIHEGKKQAAEQVRGARAAVEQEGIRSRVMNQLREREKGAR